MSSRFLKKCFLSYAIFMVGQIILVNCNLIIHSKPQVIPSDQVPANTKINQLEEYNCIDQDGAEVEWYLLYQLPYIDKQYLFITSETERRFTKGKNTMDHRNSMISRTVNQLTSSNPGDNNFFVYNDDTSFSNSSTQASYAHAKGVIVYGQKKGFWLWHSIPRLTPLPGEEFVYPDTNYGQIAACFSFDSSPGHNNRLYIETYLASIWAYCLKSRASGGQCKPFNHATDFYWFPFSTLNKAMTSEVYYKPRELNAEIYQVVADFKRRTWYVQTWHYDNYWIQNVKNIVEIRIEYLDVDNRLKTIIWRGRTLDHSKFAMDSRLENGEFCIGDLNRAVTQHLRGGGVFCLPQGKGPTGITVKYE